MIKEKFAYLLTDQSWPPELYRVTGSDPFTGLVSIVPAARAAEPGKLSRVLWVDEDDLWAMAEC